MENEFRSREYTPKDFHACCALFNQNTPKYFAKAEAMEFQSFLNFEAVGFYWVVEHPTEKIVACGGIQIKDSGVASLCYTMVRPSLQGHKIGTLLIDFCFAKINETKAVRKIELNTSQHTKDFFAKFGFTTTKVTRDSYGPGLDRYDMELILA